MEPSDLGLKLRPLGNLDCGPDCFRWLDGGKFVTSHFRETCRLHLEAEKAKLKVFQMQQCRYGRGT